MGNGIAVLVEAIGLFRLQLEIGVYLNLDETFCLPSFRSNLISISSLDKSEYSYSFGHSNFSLYQNSNIFGTGSLIDNLYMLDTNASFNDTYKVKQIISHTCLQKPSCRKWFCL